MITLLVGDNSFEIKRALERIITDSSLVAETYDGSAVELQQLPDLLMGATLFADKRLVIIKGLSANKIVWEKFSDMIDNLSENTDLVLVEDKLDKRASTYKKLVKVAKLKDYSNWDERDGATAVKWLLQEAVSMGIKLDTKIAQLIVARVGLDQWQLSHALEKLSLVKDVNSTVVEDIIDISPSENVLNLLETAIKGDRYRLESMIKTLRFTEDPQRLFALLSGQVFQLAAVATSQEGSPASDFGIHPYVVSKLKALAAKKSRADIVKIVNIFAGADDDIKISKAEPWVIIERALYGVATA